MKRTVLLIASLAITLSTTVSLVMAQPLVPSVPPLINLQGRATDNVGNPVSNGAHTFTFRIFNVPAAGAALWTEGPVGIPTAGGLFSHQLGSSTPLPIGGFIGGFFQDENQLWLEIEVDGNIISPRTQLISNPYTQVANMVETEPQNGIGIVTVRIPTPLTDCHISTYGVGGLQKSQLGNCAWGEFMLMDFTPETTATLTANPGGGGELRLTDGGGLTTIDLHGGLAGDASALLPTDAVNSGEILDEPGIASGYNSGSFIDLTSSDLDLDSAIITAPSAGYIVVIASAIDYPQHTNGTRDLSRYTISTVSGVMDFAYIATATTPAVVATDFDMPQHVALHRVDAVGGPGTYRYYFVANEFAGNCMTYQPKITAMYFPTLYGPVDVLPKPVAKTVVPFSNSSLGNSADVSQAITVQQITVEDHNARLEAERAKQIADLEARIKALEAQVNTDRLPEPRMVDPRKER